MGERSSGDGHIPEPLKEVGEKAPEQVRPAGNIHRRKETARFFWKQLVCVLFGPDLLPEDQAVIQGRRSPRTGVLSVLLAIGVRR